MAGKIYERVNDEPRLGKKTTTFSLLQVIHGTSKFCFLAEYSTGWEKASHQERANMCGNALFSKALHPLKEDHVCHGQLRPNP